MLRGLRTWLTAIVLGAALASAIATVYAQAPPLDEARVLNADGERFLSQGKLADAAPVLERALAIREANLGPDDLDLATSLDNLARLREAQGRLDEAGWLFERTLGISEKVLGSTAPATAATQNNLALLYRKQGRYDEAEPLLTRALAAREKALGPEDSSVGVILMSLAAVYQDEERFDQAEPLMKRALAVLEKSHGPDHLDVAAGLNNLGILYRAQGRNEEAEPRLKRALAIVEAARGADHVDVAAELNNLAELYQDEGRYEDAEPLMKRALAIQEKALGPGHPDVATSLNNLAVLYEYQHRYYLAQPLLLRALVIRRGALGPDHPGVAIVYRNLAALDHARGSDDNALEMARRGVEILASRADRSDDALLGVAYQSPRAKQPLFLELVHLLSTRATADQPALVDEAFQAAQRAGGVETARAVSRMAARVAAGGGLLGKLVRQRQDLQNQWRALDAALVAAASLPPDKRDSAIEDRQRRDLQSIDERLTALGGRLAGEFPRYADFASVGPVSLPEIQSLLRPHEALVMWAVADDESYLFAIRRERALLKRIEMGASELQVAVTLLRRGLEPPDVLVSLQDLPEFDTGNAVQLYRRLLAPAEELLTDVQRLIVVPDQALQSLPLGVLLTAPPTGPVQQLADYKSLPWLANRYAMTVLPAASSLRALRLFAAKTRASKPFAGFGDPDFDGTGSRRGVRLASLFRGNAVDIDVLRKLPRIPETADELRALATALHAPPSSLHLGAHASVKEVEHTDLSDVRVIAFATHGLVAHDLPGLAEPALALTPPATPTPEDDGLLTASRIAELKLNADWVVLSACNTAASDGSVGAEGLSGLARAFFYAGARSLLVSHWPVDSDAAVRLTTGAFGALAADPAIDRAEALRRSMRAMISEAGTQPHTQHFSHPMFWAPFVVVGD
jgi:CHAT domain-containing protein/tetratricopeptide (TPR) repeat protein